MEIYFSVTPRVLRTGQLVLYVFASETESINFQIAQFLTKTVCPDFRQLYLDFSLGQDRRL